MKIKDLSFRVLICIIIASAAGYFAITAGWWWLANHMAWWTWGLLSTGATFAWITGKSTVQVVREQRRRALDAPESTKATSLIEHQGMAVCGKGRRHAAPCDYGNGV